MSSTKLRLATALLMAMLFASHFAHAAATITIVNVDGAGEGFNDPAAPDADSTAGGNTGATLGAQRLIAFNRAADIWGARLNSNVVISVDAQMDPLTCSAASATLGSAGPNTVHRDFVGAPVAGTFYPQALANSLAGSDLSPANSDINATFNSSIGTICPFPNVWYYGLDANPPGNKIDFITVVLHELGHGLGFLTLVDLASGAKFGGFDDTYMLNLEDHSTTKLYPAMTNAERVTASTDTGDLHWVGPNVVAADGGLTAGRHPSGHVEMFAPSPQRPGSSVSHFSTTLSPNELMEPFFTGPNHNVRLTLELLKDIGWSIHNDIVVLGRETLGPARGFALQVINPDGTLRSSVFVLTPNFTSAQIGLSDLPAGAGGAEAGILICGQETLGPNRGPAFQVWDRDGNLQLNRLALTPNFDLISCDSTNLPPADNVEEIVIVGRETRGAQRGFAFQIWDQTGILRVNRFALTPNFTEIQFDLLEDE